MLLSSDEVMSCCAAGSNGCLGLRCCAALSGADVQAPWQGVLETEWLHCDEAKPVGCRDPVTVHKASLMTGSMRRVRALWQQTEAQYSAVEWTRTMFCVHIRDVVVPAPQPSGKGEAANTDQLYDYAEYVSAR